MYSSAVAGLESMDARRRIPIIRRYTPPLYYDDRVALYTDAVIDLRTNKGGMHS